MKREGFIEPNLVQFLSFPSKHSLLLPKKFLSCLLPKGRKALESFAAVGKISGELRTFGHDEMGEVIVFWTIWRSRKIRAARPSTE
jgi:hypothetical protein